jgi:predicted nucleotidyltransferase
VLVDTKGTNRSALQYIGMAQELEDVVGRRVDLVKYDLIRPRLKEQILKEEVRIVG